MTTVPIVNGIYADAAGDFRTSFPINLIPVPKITGISEGYLRPGYGIEEDGNGTGFDRGGVEWRGQLYRVMGTNLIRIYDGGAYDIIDTIPGGDIAFFAYSFDYLAIVADGKMWLYNGVVMTQVTDIDLGVPINIAWIDGYFVLTDGEFLYVTELNNPFSIDPAKYGSSEIDPDAIVSVLEVRNEIYAVNRNTIEVFTNAGGSGFPFQRISGAQIGKGAVGKYAAVVFGSDANTVGFVGNGVNQPVSVYLGANGGAAKIGTREIDTLLRGYTAAELANTVVESLTDLGHEFLQIHLPDQTLVYDHSATQAIQQPVWHILQTALGRYQARSHVWCYSQWCVANPKSAKFGHLTMTHGLHWGNPVVWEFAVPIIYGEGRGVGVNMIELVSLTGNGADSQVSMEYTNDGETWSQPRTVNTDSTRSKRLVWKRPSQFRNWRSYRFQGDSRSHISPARLEVSMESLAW